MCDIAHEIFVKNLQNNEVIEYRIVLVKGTINRVCQIKTARLEISHNGNFIDYESRKIKNQIDFLFTIQLNDLGNHAIKISFCNSLCETVIYRQESTNRYHLIPLYIVVKGHDGNFHSNDKPNGIEIACDKLQLGLELIQSLYAEKINENIQTRKTFRLKQKCLPYFSNVTVEEAYEWESERLWNFLVREIFASENSDPKTEKYIGFLGCTSYKGYPGIPYNYRDIFKQVKCNPAISVGGLALLGTGCLYTWANNFHEIHSRVTNQQIVDIETNLDDSNYRRTYGGCFATSLGSVCHEIGHLFDLGHTVDGMMGNDIDFINRVFSLEHRTEILPKRAVCGLERNADRDDDRHRKINPRLTKVVPQGTYLNKYHAQKSQDLSYFTQNCLLTLSHHKWLNNDGDSLADGEITLDRDTKTVISKKYPLKLVELRRAENELLIRFWPFTEKEIFEFTIPSDVEVTNHIIIFGINQNGDIIKV